MRLARVMAVAAAATMVLAACGGDDSEPEDPAGAEESGDDEGDGEEGEASGGGTVRLALGQDVETILPMDSHVGDNIAVLEVLYSGLVRYDNETTDPYNYIAEDISSDDNLTWTITIKQGFTFQNGEPVDATSFARAWNYAAYGPNAMANNWAFGSDGANIAGYDELQGSEDADPEAEELSGLRVLDDYTLEVELASPFSGFPTTLGYTGFFPIAQACLDDIAGCAVHPIGNGPFEIEEWQQGVSLTANRWDGYAGAEAPSYDRIEWTEFSGESAWPDFLAGNLDTGAPPPAEWESATSDPDLSSRLVERTGSGLTYLAFPLYLGEPWDNLDFRRAISLAVDVDAIIDAVLPGRAVTADSWVVPGGVPGGTAGTCEYCGFDPEQAQALLDSSGGWPDGEVMTIHLGQSPTEEEFFKAVGDQISLNLGIDYVLDPTDDYFSRRSARDFTGPFRANWFPDYPLNQNYLGPVYASGNVEEGNTNFGYYGADFEAKLAEAGGADSIDEAAAGYLEAERILAEDFPTVPLRFSLNSVFHSERVANVELNPFSGATVLRDLEVVE